MYDDFSLAVPARFFTSAKVAMCLQSNSFPGNQQEISGFLVALPPFKGRVAEDASQDLKNKLLIGLE